MDEDPPVADARSGPMRDDQRHAFGAIATAERWRRAQISAAYRAELSSEVNAPQARIRAWEQLYGVRLPATADHPLLDVIALITRSTLAEVHDEQRQRLDSQKRQN